ncbi:hypothetical protein [Castellaniella sp.]|uniref:hypothetical protein n=1 Tax=Castellaniella sp. TaxID=1955812 RepID=UPI003C733EE4
MEISLDLPNDDEVEAVATAAWTLAVAQYGPDPAFELVRAIFWRLLFEEDRSE